MTEDNLLNGGKFVTLIEIEMRHKKDTKGTHVFVDESENSPIPTLYIKKSALPKTVPETIRVTIELLGDN